MRTRTAIVVGSGPNGMSAAIELARAGFDVEVREAQSVAGGGARSGELTLPGFVHDLGSAVHPMAVVSPFFSGLPMHAHGLEWRWSPVELAHPLDDGTAVLLRRSVDDTAVELGRDAAAYRRIFQPLVRDWKLLMQDVLMPLLHVPKHPLPLARFGLRAVYPVSLLARYAFRQERARALLAGLGAHSILKLSAPITSAFGLMLGGSAHAVGWPIPVGGAQSITRALEGILQSYGGRVVTDCPVRSLDEIERADLKMLDITPRQLLNLAGGRLPAGFRRAMAKFRYGPGIFKVDYALRAPIPWRASECLQAITVHLGGTLEEIEKSERDAWEGRAPEKPFVLLAQPSLFDGTRAPAGLHTVWAYCHVPQGWAGSALDAIERQIERFAPGFRECVLARRTHSPAELEQSNANLVGGDIGGGAATVMQFALRPTWRGYGTPLKGVYLCSSSTAPGGGVHGMCGANAARMALRTTG
jgi:phytoene dehydrogenase-like protein